MASSQLTLHGFPLAVSYRRAALVAEEKGVDYKFELVDIVKGEHKTPEYKEMQPFGQVPYMTDEDLVLYESRAMMQYIAEKYAAQGQPLLGRDAREKARVLQWLSVEASEFNAPAMGILRERVFKKAFSQLDGDEEEVQRQKKVLEGVLDVMEKQLGKTEYLAGNELSIADLAFMPVVSYLLDAGMRKPFKSRPGLWAWWQRLSSRPSWKKLGVGTWLPPAGPEVEE